MSRSVLFKLLVGAVFSLMLSSSASAYSLYGTKWGNPVMGTGASVTWSTYEQNSGLSFGANNPVVALDTFVAPGFMSVLQDAFDAWSTVANIIFAEEVGGASDINVGGAALSASLGGGVWGLARFPTDPLGFLILNTDKNWSLNGGHSSDLLYNVFMHEIGHAIGIKHSTASGAVMGPLINDNSPRRSLSADDIAAAQAIYGVAVSAVPVPAALPLFGTGIALMGFLGWRKHRRAMA